jgi:predicted nucleic acid-binding protein
LPKIDAWLASPQAQVRHGGLQHRRILKDLTTKAKLQGGQFHDARIAAVCLENGASALYNFDRDFGRFKDLKTLNPLL